MNIVSPSWRSLVKRELCPDEETYVRFLERIDQGVWSRDENAASHFCAMFFPADPKTKKIFIIHHKKSGHWLSPGGHLDAGEVPVQTLRRELAEELGVDYPSLEYPEPFFFSICAIGNPAVACKAHFDIWYFLPTDGSNFRIDPHKFHDTRWVSVEEAKRLVTSPTNLWAIDRVSTRFFAS